MKYFQLMAYGSVIGNFLYKSFRKLSFQITGKKETVVFIHYANDESEEVILTLYIGKLVDFNDINMFLRDIQKCVTAPGWRLTEAIVRDMVPVSKWGDDMDGLEKCLLNEYEVGKFKNAYYGMFS